MGEKHKDNSQWQINWFIYCVALDVVVLWLKCVNITFITIVNYCHLEVEVDTEGIDIEFVESCGEP